MSVTRKEGGGFELRVRAHSVRADMSVEEGGADRGMKPAELLAGSLGACIAIMVQAYCDKHGYTDGEVGASLTIELADDPKRIKGIVIDLELPKDVPEDRKPAIKRVAELCPVHATLEQMPKVDLEIV